MKKYSLDPNRELTHKVIDITDEVGREGIYAGSYEDCQAYLEEQLQYCDGWGLDIIPNPYYKQKK